MPAKPPGRNAPAGIQPTGSRPIRVFNTDTEDVPPFGAMEVVGYDQDRRAFKVARCTVTGRNDLMFNGMNPIPAGMEGQARSDIHITAGYVPSEGDNPHAGELWGVPAGEWLLKPNYPGYAIVDTTTAVRGFCVVQAQRTTLTEFVRITGTGSGGAPATYYAAVLSKLDPVADTWTATTFPVWFREASGRTIGAGEYAGALDIPAVRVGYSYGRPLYVGRFPAPVSPFSSPLTTKGDIFTHDGSGDERKAVGADGYTIVADAAEDVGWKWAAVPVPTPFATSARACSWLSGFKTTECLALTVVDVGGECSAIDIDQTLFLVHSGGTWTSTADFTHDGGTGPAAFTAADPPTLTIDAVSGRFWGCDGTGGLIFSFGGSPLCAEDATECDNSFTVRVACTCCPIEGYLGEAWYCVRPAETEDDCEVVELLDEDKCDDSIEICSGPYETEDDAAAVCVPVIYNLAACGAVDPCFLPDRVRVTITSACDEFVADTGGTKIVYATHGVFDLWNIDASGEGWSIGGAFTCNQGTCDPGYCGPPINFNGGAVCGGAVAYQCCTYVNQDSTGSIVPFTGATVTLSIGFTLLVEDFGPGDPDC